MNLRQIQTVVTIAECGSLRKAARLLDLTQPAITRGIHDLERELGAPLFERNATGVTLTDIGAAFVRRAASFQHELERARSEVEQMKGREAASIAVGLSTVSHLALYPRVIGAFERRFPDVRLRVIEGLFPALEGQLRRGELDFYVGPLSGEPHPPELGVEPLFNNRRMVFARPGHPLARATSLAELSGARWVTTALTPISEDELTPLFAQHGLEPPHVTVNAYTSISMILTAAHSDLLAMMPQQWLPVLEMGGLLVRVPVRETLASATICIVTRTSFPLTPIAERLADLFRRAAINHALTLPDQPVLTA